MWGVPLIACPLGQHKARKDSIRCKWQRILPMNFQSIMPCTVLSYATGCTDATKPKYKNAKAVIDNKAKMVRKGVKGLCLVANTI